MKSWNGSVNAVVAATARSTYSSPSTSRRTLIPRSARSASSMLVPLAFFRFLVLVGVKGRGDKGRRGAEVAGRLERGIDLLRRDSGRGQPALQLRHGKQHVAQWQSG